MALVALEIAGRIEVVVVARRDFFTGQQVGNVKANDLGGIIVRGSGFDALEESWDEAEVDGPRKSHGTIEGPDGNAAPEEAVEFSFEDFEVAGAVRQLNITCSGTRDRLTSIVQR